MFKNPLKYSLPILFIILLGCSSEDEITPTELEASELEFLKNLLTTNQTMGEIWSDFNLRVSPIYILAGEGEGFLMNPSATMIDASLEVTYEIDGLPEIPVYRNQEFFEIAQQELIEARRFFAFPSYKGENTYFYKVDNTIFSQEDPDRDDDYLRYKNRADLAHVSIFFHELFHFYQFQQPNFFTGDDQIQDITSYPLTIETLPLQLLLFEVMADAFKAEDKEESRDYLRYYVSIEERLERIDPTANKLIRSHGFYQEKIEGTARFVEDFSRELALGNTTLEDPTHGFRTRTATITSREDVNYYYKFRIFYHVGAGAIYLLRTLDFPNLEEAFRVPENTPFDIASEFLKLDESEKESAFEEVKALYDFNSLEERASFLLSLP